MDQIDSLDDQIEALAHTLGAAGTLTAAFDNELKRMQATVSDTGREVGVLSRGISRGLRSAFDGLVFDGLKLGDALKEVAESMSRAAYSAAIRPLTSHFGGLLAEGVEGAVNSLLPFQNGAGFAHGRVMPFARGGVVSQATLFPMRGGTGLMGESGPEAIMPLARGADGRLGVQAAGSGAVNMTFNIQTPDIEGFRRSEAQIAAMMGRALGRGARNR